MSQLTDIIIKSGLLSDDMIAEMKRWGMPVEGVAPPTELEAPMPIEKICDAIDEAIQSEGYVLMRETDLEAIPQYLNSMRQGILHIVTDEDGSGTNFDVQVGQNSAGEYIVPWRSESITDLLTNGQTYLKIGKDKIFFGAARELFYGNNRAFVVCTPATKEPDGNRQ